MPTLIEKIAINLLKGEIGQAREKLKTLKKGENHKILCDIIYSSYKNWFAGFPRPRPYDPVTTKTQLHFPSGFFDNAFKRYYAEVPLAIFAIYGPEPDCALSLLKERKIPFLETQIIYWVPTSGGYGVPERFRISIQDFLVNNTFVCKKNIKCLLKHYYAENIRPYIYLESTMSDETFKAFDYIQASENKIKQGEQNDVADSLHQAITQDINFSIELFSIYVNKAIETQNGHREFFKTFSRLIKADIEKASPEKKDEFEQALQKASDKDSLITWESNKEKTWHFSQSKFFGKLKKTFPELKEPRNNSTALENAAYLEDAGRGFENLLSLQ